MISVVIPTYNRGGKVAPTVESVLQQTLPPDEVEILIVDDGSTDETWSFLQASYGSHPQIRLFRIENCGVARARNFGLEQARGEFIAYLDHDDCWLPHKLEAQLAKMRNPRVGVVYSNWISIDEDGQEIDDELQLQKQSWWHPAEGRIYPWIYVPHRTTHVRNSIISMSIPLMRTELIRRVGGFDLTTVPSDDWDLWIRLSRQTHFSYVPDVLVHYLWHENQQHKNTEKATRSGHAILTKHHVPVYKNPWLWHKGVKFKKILENDRTNCFYEEAKKHLFNREINKFRLVVKKQFLRAPQKICSKRWIYLIYRAATRKYMPY